MKYTLQVFTGSWHDAHDQPEKILGRITEISRRIPVERVIIGWNADTDFYRTLGEGLHQAGIQTLLWLPAFTEIREAAETDEALDLAGQRIVPPGKLAEEAFAFDCPSSRKNLQAVKALFEKYFSGCGLTGFSWTGSGPSPLLPAYPEC